MAITTEQMQLLKARGFLRPPARERPLSNSEVQRRELIKRYNQLLLSAEQLEEAITPLFRRGTHKLNTSKVTTPRDVQKYLAKRSARYRSYLATRLNYAGVDDLLKPPKLSPWHLREKQRHHLVSVCLSKQATVAQIQKMLLKFGLFTHEQQEELLGWLDQYYHHVIDLEHLKVSATRDLVSLDDLALVKQQMHLRK